MDGRAADKLDGAAIRGSLGPETGAALQRLTVLPRTDSTNAFLARLAAAERHGHAVLAETQTAGRGRRQRAWHSPPGANLYLSLGWRFGGRDLSLSTLPLVAAVCLCRMLERCGLQEHGIKWPNDILVDGRKLAGILVESQSVPGQAVFAVIGIGLNVDMPGEASDFIDRPWTDLASVMRSNRRPPCRNVLAARLLDALLPALPIFAKSGFASFRQDWNRRDLLSGRRVALEDNGVSRAGSVIGIDDNGGLSVELDGVGPRVLHAADVSVLDA